MELPMLSAGFRFKYGEIIGLSIWFLLYFSPHYLPGQKSLRILLLGLGLGALISLAYQALRTRLLRVTEWGVAVALSLVIAIVLPIPSPLQDSSGHVSDRVLPPPGITPEAIYPLHGFRSTPWTGWFTGDLIEDLITTIYIIILSLYLGLFLLNTIERHKYMGHISVSNYLSSRKMILAYAFPCWLVWSIYFITFYPGILPIDAIYQWKQILSGHFDNIHPAAHTLSMALIYRIWPSPAGVALAQMMMLGLTIGVIARALERWGVPSLGRWGLVGLSALAPGHGMMSVTLWKDIPYTIGLLGLTGGLLHLVRDFLDRQEPAWSTWIGLVGSGLAVALYRHNGLPVVLLAMGTIAILWPRRRIRFLLRTIFPILACYLAVQATEIYVLRIPPVPRWFALQVPIHHVAALIYAGTPLTSAERDFLNQIQPLDLWHRAYTCRFVDPVVNNNVLNRAFFDAHADKFLSLWAKLIARNPRAIIRHYLCSTDFLWRITEPPDAYVYAFEWGTPANPLGLSSQALLPRLRGALWRLLGETLKHEWIWLFWRPALFLYSILFTGSILARRYGLRIAWTLIGPAVIHTLLWFPLLTAPDFRFQYPIYGIAICLFPMLWSGKVRTPGRDTQPR